MTDEIIIATADLRKIIQDYSKLVKEDVLIDFTVMINYLKRARIILETLKEPLNQLMNGSNIFGEDLSSIIINLSGLIFLLREISLGEKIDLKVAGLFDDNSFGEQTYKFFPDLFNNATALRYSCSAGAVELTSEILQIKQDESSNKQKTTWADILKYGIVSKDALDKIDTPKGYGYQNPNPADKNVYVKWGTVDQKKRQLYHYYKINSKINFSTMIKRETLKRKKDFLAYDKGWLYQWASAQKFEFTIDKTSEYPLQEFFSSKEVHRDTVPGVRGGDVGLSQLKYQNKKLIKLKNIYNILYGTAKNIKSNNEYIGLYNSLVTFGSDFEHLTETSFFNILLDFVDKNQNNYNEKLNHRIDDLFKNQN